MKELLQQALDALRQCEFTSPPAQRPIVKDAITALREALAAPMPEPSDMVMVPREPTPDMARAGRKAVAAVADKMEAAKQLAVHVIDFWQQVGHTPANEIYRAMIAAAPPAAPAPVVPEDMAALIQRVRVLEDALTKIAKSSPHEDGCYYTNRGNIAAARAALGDKT